MYGPVATTCVLYVEGFFSSYFCAYSLGTGTVIGMTSAAATPTPEGLESLMTRVWSSGVSRPAMLLNLPGFLGAPTMSVKYVVYWLATFCVNARSNAYLTSLDVTSRLTGGENFTPLRSFTVTVLRSEEISGSDSARSGVGSCSSGL